jgi:hypothetical protein
MPAISKSCGLQNRKKKKDNCVCFSSFCYIVIIKTVLIYLATFWLMVNISALYLEFIRFSL